MHNIKYIVLDFDGTILNSKGEISTGLINKLIDLQENGYKIILCSGRSVNGIQDVANKINIFSYGGYIIAYNGSQIYKCINGRSELLRDIEFSKEEAEAIANLVIDDAKSFVTYDEEYMSASNKIPILSRSSKVMGLKLDNNYIKKTPKILLFDDPERIEQIHGSVRERIYSYNKEINVFSSVSHIIEITPPLAEKGIALSFLCRYFKLNPSNFICFGDNGNDISMFEFCKYSVAMENAIPNVKKIATHHTLSNNDDGVLFFLKNNF